MKRCEIEKIGMCSVAKDIKPLIGNVNPALCEQCGFKTDIRIINILKTIKIAKKAEEFYGLGGDCGILSLTIQRILGGGQLIAIGGRVRVKGHMQHTGLLINSIVLDVDGLTSTDSWISRWKDDRATIFLDELNEDDILLGTCPRNTQKKYLIDLKIEAKESQVNKKDPPKNRLGHLLGIKEILFLSIIGTSLSIFYLEKRINPDFIRDIIYLFLLKLGDSITSSHSKKNLQHKNEEGWSKVRKELEDSEIDEKLSADISKSMLFLIIPAVLILSIFSIVNKGNFVYSLGLFFIYFAFSFSILLNLWRRFGSKKR